MVVALVVMMVVLMVGKMAVVKVLCSVEMKVAKLVVSMGPRRVVVLVAR